MKNGSRWSDYLDGSNGISVNVTEGGKYDLEGADSRRPLDPSTRGGEDGTSVPLLIVGNKIDKLTASEKLEVQTACPQQIFVVCYFCRYIPLPPSLSSYSIIASIQLIFCARGTSLVLQVNR